MIENDLNALEKFKLYLPKYLSSESEKELFNNLNDFPDNIDSKLYTYKLRDHDIIYQGDGIRDMPVISLPYLRVENVRSIIISNTCDIDKTNSRNFPTRMVYAPIFSLEKYQGFLLKMSKKTP